MHVGIQRKWLFMRNVNLGSLILFSGTRIQSVAESKKKVIHMPHLTRCQRLNLPFRDILAKYFSSGTKLTLTRLKQIRANSLVRSGTCLGKLEVLLDHLILLNVVDHFHANIYVKKNLQETRLDIQLNTSENQSPKTSLAVKVLMC